MYDPYRSQQLPTTRSDWFQNTRFPMDPTEGMQDPQPQCMYGPPQFQPQTRPTSFHPGYSGSCSNQSNFSRHQYSTPSDHQVSSFSVGYRPDSQGQMNYDMEHLAASPHYQQQQTLQPQQRPPQFSNKFSPVADPLYTQDPLYIDTHQVDRNLTYPTSSSTCSPPKLIPQNYHHSLSGFSAHNYM